MAEINVEMLKERLYTVASALFRISETCVDVSKQHISEKEAFDKIRGYLNDAGMWSRFKVDRLIEECIEPTVTNTFGEPYNDWLNKWLKEGQFNAFEEGYPSCCDGCPNNPKNGGSGICNCAIPYMQNPTNYTVSDDSCMINNINGNVYFTTSTDSLVNYKDNSSRIAEAVERTRQYIVRKYMVRDCPECGKTLEVYYDGPHCGDPDNSLIRHCKNCLCDWESEWHEDGSETELRRKFWG